MSKQQALILSLLFLSFLYRFQLLVYPLLQQGKINTFQKQTQAKELVALFTPAKDRIEPVITSLFPPAQSALLAGILFGEKAQLPKDLKQALVNTSTIHIAVVSGQNLSLLAGLLTGFVGLLGRKKVLVLNLGLLTFYALFTGFQIPVIRALLMLGIGNIAQLFGREALSWFVLLATGLVMLIYEPIWVFSPSFQLSFIATIAVIFVAPLLDAILLFFPKPLKGDITTSFSAQLLTLPVIAYHFHQISLIGVLSNLLVLWTIAPLMVTGSLAVLAGLFYFPLGQILSIVPLSLLDYFIFIVRFLAELSLAKVTVPSLPLVVWGGYYLVLAGVLLGIKKSQKS